MNEKKPMVVTASYWKDWPPKIDPNTYVKGNMPDDILNSFLEALDRVRNHFTKNPEENIPGRMDVLFEKVDQNWRVRIECWEGTEWGSDNLFVGSF